MDGLAKALPARPASVRWPFRALLLIVLAAFAFRSFVAAPRYVPSESMLPTLMPGELILVAKWPYGWSRHSLAGAPPIFSGRLLGRSPERGDVVVFRPDGSDTDEVKRVIGLPGDVVQLTHGALTLNGHELPREETAAAILPLEPNDRCWGTPVAGGCRYRRFVETLPGGTHYATLDTGPARYDTTPPIRVPAGKLFLLGDNRDRSGDSRMIGSVPFDRLIGRPLFVFWSGNGAWFGLRSARIGALIE